MPWGHQVARKYRSSFRTGSGIQVKGLDTGLRRYDAYFRSNLVLCLRQYLFCRLHDFGLAQDEIKGVPGHFFTRQGHENWIYALGGGIEPAAGVAGIFGV